MSKPFVVATLAALLLTAGHAAADQAVYAPYRACMADCLAEESSCIDHIPPGAADPEGLKAECVSTKTACVAECQFLPIPPQDGTGQPPQGAGQAGQGGVQGEEPVQQQEPAASQEAVPAAEPVAPLEPPQQEEPALEPGQGEQPPADGGAQQGGAPQEGAAQQQEPETLNGIKIYQFQ